MKIPYPLRQEWAITAAGRDLVLGVWQTAHTLPHAERIAAAIEARDGEPFPARRGIEVRDGVAILSVDGPIMRKAELFSDISGATSYERIIADVAAVREMKARGECTSAVIKFNTPGGEAAGCGICADAIDDLTRTMRVEAYVETQASSAGWWLASQCSRITAHEQARTGSQGVRAMLTDDSARDEKEGVREIEVIAEGGPEKRTTPVDKAVVGRAQVMADEIFDVFAANVARGRGVTVEQAVANFGRGAEVIAAKALDAGMIDAIGSFDSVLARLGSRASTRANAPQRKIMAKAKADPAVVEAAAVAPEAAAPMKCNNCGGSCSAGGEPDEDDQESKAAAAFGRQALALLGTTDTAAALGLVKAGAEELATQAAARVKAAADAKAQAKADFLAAVKGGIEGGKLTIASAASVLDFVDEEQAGKVRAALASAAATLDATMAAFALADVTPREAKSVKTFVEQKGPALPGAHRPPANTKGNRAEVHKQLAATAGANGIPGDAVKSFAALTIAEIERQVDSKSNSKQGA